MEEMLAMMKVERLWIEPIQRSWRNKDNAKLQCSKKEGQEGQRQRRWEMEKVTNELKVQGKRASIGTRMSWQSWLG